MANEHLRAFQGTWSRPDANSKGGKLKILYAVLAVDHERARQLIVEKIGLPVADVAIERGELGQELVERLQLKPNKPVEISSGL